MSLRDNGRYYYYTIIAWRDLFSSWREEITKKHGAGLSVELELEEGRLMVERSLQGEPRRSDPGDLRALRSLLNWYSEDRDKASRLHQTPDIPQTVSGPCFCAIMMS